MQSFDFNSFTRAMPPKASGSSSQTQPTLLGFFKKAPAALSSSASKPAPPKAVSAKPKAVPSQGKPVVSSSPAIKAKEGDAVASGSTLTRPRQSPLATSEADAEEPGSDAMDLTADLSIKSVRFLVFSLLTRISKLNSQIVTDSYETSSCRRFG